MNIIKTVLLKIPLIKKVLEWKHAYVTQKKLENLVIGNVGLKNESFRLEWTKRQLLTLPKGLRLLDAGAGEGQFKPYCEHLKYLSQDFAQYDGKGDGSGLQTQSWDNSKLDIISDILDIPEPDSSFDAILCTEVLEHIPEPSLAIKEFSRLLKSGGKLILTAPFCSLTHFSPYHFSTGFNKYFYEHHLKLNQFKIEEMTANGNYFEYLAQELHRLDTIAKNYSVINYNPTKEEIFAKKSLLNVLSRLSETDSSSNELLCFGYLVVAQKL